MYSFYINLIKLFIREITYHFNGVFLNSNHISISCFSGSTCLTKCFFTFKNIIKYSILLLRYKFLKSTYQN